MDFVKYLIQLRGLMNLKRYQNLFLFKQRSVAEHSWSVSKIAQSLAYVEMHQFGKQVDMALLLQKTLGHDELELITGDILSHTKKRVPSMKRAVAFLEKEVFHEEYVHMIPKEWKKDFQGFTLDAKDDTIEGHLLHASDVIDTLFEALEEIKLGNREYFTGVLKNSLEKLFQMELDSVHHFLHHFLCALKHMKYDLQEEYGDEFVAVVDKWKVKHPQKQSE